MTLSNSLPAWPTGALAASTGSGSPSCIACRIVSTVRSRKSSFTAISITDSCTIPPLLPTPWYP